MLLELRQRLLAQPDGDGRARYNVPLLNSLVLHVGMHAIAQMHSKGPQPASPLSNCAPMDLFQQLASELDSEGCARRAAREAPRVLGRARGARAPRCGCGDCGCGSCSGSSCDREPPVQRLARAPPPHACAPPALGRRSCR